MGQVKKVVGYIRVSDESQAEQDKASLPEQERLIREYCHSKGYDLLEVFSDVGKRWDAERPAFKRMLSLGYEKPRPFDSIIVWRADRIVGSARTVAALEPLLDEYGVDIEGVTGIVDKHTLLTNAQIAKGETEAKRYRGKLGIKTAVSRGHYPGMLPYGRRWDKELKKMVIEESEAHWYREMFAWSIVGDGDEKIAKRLNQFGIPTRRQGQVTKSGRIIGKGWTTSYVRKLLTDPSAYGEGKVQIKGGERFDFPMLPVVDKETFMLAMKARESRRHFGQKPTNRYYLISPRKGKCAECGLGFRVESRSYRVKKKMSDGQTRVYQRKILAPGLVCRGMYMYPHIHQCRHSRHVDFDKVQTVILRKVSEVLSTDDFALVCAMPDGSEVERIAARLKDARVALEQMLREINFVVTEGRTGRIPKPVFDTQIVQLNQVLEYRQNRVNQLESEYQNSQDKIRKYEQVMPTVELLKGFWNTLRNCTVNSNNLNKDDGLKVLPFEKSNIEKLRYILDILVESFTVDHDGNVSVELSIPVINDIESEALSCRQLANIHSPW